MLTSKGMPGLVTALFHPCPTNITLQKKDTLNITSVRCPRCPTPSQWLEMWTSWNSRPSSTLTSCTTSWMHFLWTGTLIYITDDWTIMYFVLNKKHIPPPPHTHTHPPPPPPHTHTHTHTSDINAHAVKWLLTKIYWIFSIWRLRFRQGLRHWRPWDQPALFLSGDVSRGPHLQRGAPALLPPGPPGTERRSRPSRHTQTLRSSCQARLWLFVLLTRWTLPHNNDVLWPFVQ